MITTYLFTQQIVLELGLLNYFDAWSLEPTPFFSKLQMMALIGKVWTMTFHMLFPFRFSAARGYNLAGFFFRPLKRVHVSTFPPKKRCRDSLRFKKLLLSPSTPWELGSPHHLIIATVTTESFEELVQFLMIYRRREGFSHKEARVSWRGKGP